MAKRNSVVDEITYAIDDVRQKLIEQGWTGSIQTPQTMQSLPDNTAGIDTSPSVSQQEASTEQLYRDTTAGKEADSNDTRDIHDNERELEPEM